MTDIISRKLSNDRAYAYHAGAFWAWDEDRQVWKESALLTKQYGLNRDVDQTLTPEDFLSDPSRFRPLEDYEVDCIMRQALQTAAPDRKTETALRVPVVKGVPKKRREVQIKMAIDQAATLEWRVYAAA